MSYTYETINVNKLFLNSKNYRIDFERYQTQSEIVERLYEEEDIIEMIKGIVSFQGIYPHESLIVIPNNKNGYTVMEGNRRLLAIKTLLDIIKPPIKYESEVVNLRSKLKQENLNTLKELRCVVYNLSDNEYLKIIADKHSTVNYARWGQISQWHFFKDTYISNGKDLGKTSSELGKSKGDVSNYIHFYNLISYIRSLPYWDQKGLRNEIEKNKLKATKFTRPLGSTSVQNELKIEFDDELELKIPDSNKAEFDYILCTYAEASLINDKSDDDFIYTRSEPDQVTELIKGWKEEYEKNFQKDEKPNYGLKNENDSKTDETTTKNDKSEGKNGDEGKRGENLNEKKHRTRTPTQHPRYFRQLRVSKTLNDPQLEHIAAEISKITVKNFPLATLLLTRSLIEKALIYRLRKKQEWEGFMKEMQNYKTKNGQTTDRRGNFTLDDIVKYCINRVENLFSDYRTASLAKKALAKFQDKNGIRKDLNDMTHESLAIPSETRVQSIADEIRPLIEKILLEEE